MTPKGLFLTPGAGSSAEHSSLRAIEAAVRPLPVVRHDFPYRKEGRKAPDRAPKLLDDLEAHAPGPHWVYGGRSMGGRMCSMAVADGRLPTPRGLVLICYPLHPPGKPENLRTEHLLRLTVPCLFVSGTRDAFGAPDELEAATATIPGDVTHVWLEGKGHDLRGADEAIVDAVVSWLTTLR